MAKDNNQKPDKRPKPEITTSRPQNVVLHNLNANDMPNRIVIKVEKRSPRGKGKS
jgi:hypothetical protein